MPRREHVITCTHCRKHAVHQWQRLATPDEAGGHVQVSAERVQFDDEMRRATQRDVIKSLEARLSDPDWPAHMVPALERQIAGEKARLDAIEDTVIPDLSARPVTVAVFGCADHRVSDEESTRLHESSCLSDGPCACVTAASPLVMEMSPEMAAIYA